MFDAAKARPNDRLHPPPPDLATPDQRQPQKEPGGIAPEGDLDRVLQVQGTSVPRAAEKGIAGRGRAPPSGTLACREPRRLQPSGAASGRGFSPALCHSAFSNS